MTPSFRVLVGDCREVLRALPAASAHVCVTSPPYYGLRDYGLPASVWGGSPDCEHAWESAKHRITDHGATDRDPYARKRSRLPAITAATCSRCGAWRGCLGLEPHPDLYVAHLVEVFREVRRVLRADGTLWLNIGDSYARRGSGGGLRPENRGPKTAAAQLRANRGGVPDGLKEKDLLGMPWAVAFALRADGWHLRQEVIWHKRNPLPEAIEDRPARSHEQVFLLSPGPRYFYDPDAVMERARGSNSRGKGTHPKSMGAGAGVRANESYSAAVRHPVERRHLRSVWTLSSRPFKGAHTATFPPGLAEPCVRAGTSERGCCASCGAPVARVVERTRLLDGVPVQLPAIRSTAPDQPRSGPGPGHGRITAVRRTLGWRPTCGCGAGAEPCTVLDPFSGAGTTGLVALGLGRSYLGIELSAEYAADSQRRLADVAPLFVAPAAAAGGAA